jgi:hypothetical protein
MKDFKILYNEPDVGGDGSGGGNPTPPEPPKPIEGNFDFEAVSKQLTEEHIEKLLENTEHGKKFKDKLNSRFLAAYTGEEGGQIKIINQKLAEQKVQIEEEFRKKYSPDETPEQKEIRELKERLDKNDKEKQNSDLKNSLINELTDKEMVTLMDLFVAGDLETSKERINKLNIFIKDKVDKEVEKQIKEKINDSSYKPDTGNGKLPTTKFQEKLNAGQSLTADEKKEYYKKLKEK